MTQTSTTEPMPTVDHYRFDADPSLVPLREGTWSDDLVRACGEDPDDEEICCSELAAEWRGYPEGTPVVHGLAVTGHPLHVARYAATVHATVTPSIEAARYAYAEGWRPEPVTPGYRHRVSIGVLGAAWQSDDIDADVDAAIAEIERLAADTQAITDAQIRTLRTEARLAGDLGQVHVCDVALGDEDPILTGEQYEERYGGGGLADYEQSAVMAATSQEVARRMCAEAIAEARD